MAKLIKRFINIMGNEFPAVQVGDPVSTTVELSNGKKVPALIAEVISLRTTNPANGPVTSYLTSTPENLRFSPLRFTTVPGLDVDGETGEVLDLEALEVRRGADIRARQLALAEQNGPTRVTLTRPMAESAPEATA